MRRILRAIATVILITLLTGISWTTQSEDKIDYESTDLDPVASALGADRSPGILYEPTEYPDGPQAWLYEDGALMPWPQGDSELFDVRRKNE